MPRFFVGELSPLVTITGEDASHIARSLRMREGEALTLCDGRANEADGVLRAVRPDEVTVELGAPRRSPGEPSLAVTLYQACPKGDKFDLIVQKAVELGVSRVVLTLTSRCVSRPKEQDVAKKLARYQKIANEAAKQCGRGVLPKVDGLYSFEEAVREASDCEVPVIFYEGECRPLRELLPQKAASLSMIIGSEGGFSQEEIGQARGAGLVAASLGARILRCETAPVAALSAVMYHFGEL